MKYPSATSHGCSFWLFIGAALVASDRAALLAKGITESSSSSSKPNFIILQPDDLEFFEKWTPPHFPLKDESFDFPDIGLPNIETLRNNGVQMVQAYAASPMCSTSRYSTITGRYPSRSSHGRDLNFDVDVADVVVSKTKLRDLEFLQDGNDCRDNNLAALLRRNGYRTGVVGKWHLEPVSRREGPFRYADFREQIRDCGFDFAEALYAENLDRFWTDGGGTAFSHNMEHVAERAIEFVRQAADDDDPFFLYLNPTIPHSSGDVLSALTDYDCTDTPGGRLDAEPVVPEMTAGLGCTAYRQTVLNRANGDISNNNLGSIWLDDAIGAVLSTLETTGQLHNTFFLFQMDHGQEGKGTLWEPGVRVAQFISFPSRIPSGIKFRGMVSTIDIGPTILDYAGIDGNSPGYYEMDGVSWREAMKRSIDATTWNENRCLFFETDRDRAVRCGCYKYMQMDSLDSRTARRGRQRGVAASSSTVLFDLCADDSGDRYDDENSRETVDVSLVNPEVYDDLGFLVDCHLQRTLPSAKPDYDTECGPSTVNLAPTAGNPPLSASPAAPSPAMDPPTSFPATASPTAKAPYASPTFSPTASPLGELSTSSPSISPSASGSLIPTASPVPSSPPSSIPSEVPSHMPSFPPSLNPSTGTSMPTD